MHLKNIIAILLTLISAGSVTAQKYEERVLDSCFVEVVYQRMRVTDTLKPKDDYELHDLTLRAGNKASAMYSAEGKTIDSLSAREPKVFFAIMMDRQRFREFSHKNQFMVIFKMKPEGKIINHDFFDSSSWKYEEPLDTPRWEITDSVMVIDGINCVKATADYRGREWTAWFAPEIPFNEGPWKLWGLPGLIVRAYDSKGHYRFEAKSISVMPGGYVDYFDYGVRSRLKTKRIRALKTKRNALQVSIVARMKQKQIPKEIIDKVNVPKILEHRNYDFEETDYPHE